MTTPVRSQEGTVPTAPPPPATTLPSILLRRAEQSPRAVAMRKKELGRWRPYTWAEYVERAARIGNGLMELGVGRGDRVAVHSLGRPAWLLADQGIQGIGAVTVGLYPTSPAAEVGYVLRHSESVVLVAEDEEQLDKALEARAELPHLRHIVVVDPRGVRVLDDPMITTLAQLEELGASRPAAEFADRVACLRPDDIAVTVYTSGTTGPPKGAMLTHANLLAAAVASSQVYQSTASDEVLSYLPLCHIAERLVSIINAIHAGYTVNFGSGAEGFATDLQEVQPTFFLGVPRVWEKMMAAVQIRMADASRLKRALFEACLRDGHRVAARRLRREQGVVDRLRYRVAWLLAFRSLRHKLGLSRVRVALSGAAPIAPQVLEFLAALGVDVREGYGQTENTALATYTPADDIRIGTVGRALPSVELRIAPDGEILTRSAGVFAGYFKDEDATRSAVDADGWLHTGDVGELTDDGFLTITDRKKDIVITAGGKNVAPSEIENKLKTSPYIREAIVVGDGRKYLSALVGIEPDTVGDWATRRGLPFTTYRDLSSKPEVRRLVAADVERVNAELAQVETIKRFDMLPVELDEEEGQLTATQKVKRRVISEQFADLIEGMYR
ncbi:MAG: AMP-dependent synthetase/ligase [Acidimicrobiia bacterium]